MIVKTRTKRVGCGFENGFKALALVLCFIWHLSSLANIVGFSVRPWQRQALANLRKGLTERCWRGKLRSSSQRRELRFRRYIRFSAPWLQRRLCCPFPLPAVVKPPIRLDVTSS